MLILLACVVVCVVVRVSDCPRHWGPAAGSYPSLRGFARPQVSPNASSTFLWVGIEEAPLALELSSLHGSNSRAGRLTDVLTLIIVKSIAQIALA